VRHGVVPGWEAVSGHLLWSVFVDRPDEKRWRETLGQASIDAWCTAHGWDANNILSGSVAVYAYRDGHAEAIAYESVRSDDGKPVWIGDRPAQVTVAAPLRQSLPEGIGTVIR
jgi:hypothetical protein